MLSLGVEGAYRPKTRETRAAYEALLGQIGGVFGDQPQARPIRFQAFMCPPVWERLERAPMSACNLLQDILRGAADEVLAVLKDDRKTDPERKREVEQLLGPIASEQFALLVARALPPVVLHLFPKSAAA